MTLHASFKLAAVALCTISTSAALASLMSSEDESPQPWHGARGVTVSVAELVRRAELDRQIAQDGDTEERAERELIRPAMSPNPNSPAVAFWPLGNGSSAPFPGGGGAGALLPPQPQSVGIKFLMSQRSDSGAFPVPDSNGSVSLTQVFEHVNKRIRVFDKYNPAQRDLDLPADTFWDSVRQGEEVADPTVMYDRLTDRWFVVALARLHVPDTSNRLLIAVSSPGRITMSSDFTFYYFEQDDVLPVGDDAGRIVDHPKPGIDANALYIGCTIAEHPIGLAGFSAFVVRKAELLQGGSQGIVVTAFRGVGTLSSGMWSPVGVTNDDPTATHGYFIAQDAGTFGRLIVRRVNDPGGSPTLTANMGVDTPTTEFPIPARAESNNLLSPIDLRLQQAQIRLNRKSGVRTLWTAQNIQVNASGVASSSGGRDAMRWYEIENLASVPPTLRQSGTMFDPSSNPVDYWMGACTMSGQGHMAVGCSQACDAQGKFAGIAAAGRLAEDTLGQTRSASEVQAGTAQYTSDSGVQLWGDYSSAWIDPSDDQSIWIFQEYCCAEGQWGVMAAQLLAPPPATPGACSPSIVRRGTGNIDLTIDGVSSSGSAFFDTDATYPTDRRISADLGAAGITINSTNRVSDTRVVVSITVDANAGVGARSITIRNPDLQTATGQDLLVVLCLADVNDDGFISGDDFDIFAEWFDAGNAFADINNDGFVNGDDFDQFSIAFEAGC